MKPVTLIIVLLGLAVALTIPAGLTLAQSLGDPVAEELSQLSVSIDRLTSLLAQQEADRQEDLHMRRLDLAIAYLNFRSRRIEMLERDIQTARNNKGRLEDITRQLNQETERLIERLQEDPQSNAEEIEAARDELNQRKRIMDSRMARLDTEIIELEIKVQELQNQIDSVEAFVQRNFDL